MKEIVGGIQVFLLYLLLYSLFEWSFEDGTYPAALLDAMPGALTVGILWPAIHRLARAIEHRSRRDK